MAESGMRENLCRRLKKLDAVAVENPARPGTPDVNFIGGWIECKWLRAWPKRVGTPVKLDHPLLAGQKVWIRRRNRRGGKAWVMLQCGREWLLFRGGVACDFLGTSTRQELYRHVYHVWRSGLDADELIAVLETNRPDRVRTKQEDIEAAWDQLGGSHI